MPLSVNDLSEISKKLYSIDSLEWNQIVIRLNRTQELDHFLSLLGHEEYHPLSNILQTNKSGKILIIGSSQVKEKDVIKACKELNISEQRLELVLEYKDNYNFIKTHNNPDYAAILVGPLPHMAKGVDGYSSIISKIETENGYPPVIRIRNTTGDLHISKKSLKNCLTECVKNNVITT